MLQLPDNPLRALTMLAIDVRDLFYPTRSGAGARAHERFKTLSHRWRHRALRVRRRVAILLALPLVAGAIVDHHLLSWGLGLALGAVEALWLWISDSPCLLALRIGARVPAASNGLPRHSHRCARMK